MLTRRVRLAGVEYLFCDARAPAPAGARKLRPRELQSLLAQSGTQPVVRGMLAELAGRRPERARRLPGQRGGRDAWAEATEDPSGSLVAYELPSAPPRLSAMVIPAALELPEPSAGEPSLLFDEPTHWIEVQIVGEDDRGIPGMLCEVKLPSGKTVRRSTDRFGLIRIEGITNAGACEFTLPNLDREAWCPA